MDIIIPTPDIILVAHEVVLEKSGGRPGVLNQSVISGAVQRPITYTQYITDYDIHVICALLVDSIARNHGFNDGNKRTAMLVAIVTYNINDYTFRADDDTNTAFDNLVMWVVTEKPTVDELSVKLKLTYETHKGSSTYFDAITSFISMINRRKK